MNMRTVMMIFAMLSLTACGSYDDLYRDYANSVGLAREQQQALFDKQQERADSRIKALAGTADKCQTDTCRMQISSQAAIVAAALNGSVNQVPEIELPRPPQQQVNPWVSLFDSVLGKGLAAYGIKKGADIATNASDNNVELFRAGYGGVSSVVGHLSNSIDSLGEQAGQPGYQANGDLYVVGGDFAGRDNVGGGRGDDLGDNASINNGALYNVNGGYAGNDNIGGDRGHNLSDGALINSGRNNSDDTSTSISVDDHSIRDVDNSTDNSVTQPLPPVPVDRPETGIAPGPPSGDGR